MRRAQKLQILAFVGEITALFGQVQMDQVKPAGFQLGPPREEDQWASLG